MAKLAMVVLHLLTVFTTWDMTSGLEWQTMSESLLYACTGDQVTFPWVFRTEENEMVVDMHWVFNGAMSEELMATMTFDHFLATEKYADRVSQVADSGLSLLHVAAVDTGNYTLVVNVQDQGSFSSHRKSIYLQVGDGLMLKGRKLTAVQDPVAMHDDVNEMWNIRLRCGTFIFTGQPPLDVVWTTPTGESTWSSGYDSGDFYLSLVTPVQGGTYNCSIPPNSLSAACYHNQGNDSITASVSVDEIRSRLSLLEAGQMTLKKEDRLLHEQHTQDINNLTEYLTDLKAAQEQEIETLRVEYQSMQDDIQVLWNKSLSNQKLPIHENCADIMYESIDDPRRSPEQSDGADDLCDKTLLRKWYRFFMNGESAVVPTTCVPTHKCSTDAPMWLDLQSQSLPAVGEQIRARACAHWSSNCCNWKSPIDVMNCGSFFIYKVQPLSTCHLAYCAVVQS